MSNRPPDPPRCPECGDTAGNHRTNCVQRERDAIRAIILDAVSHVLIELDVVAHNPIQGEAMHKVITGHLLARLDAHGYEVTSKRAADE